MGKHRPSVACRRGHPWVEGSYWVWRGYKHCKICRRRRWAETYGPARQAIAKEAREIMARYRALATTTVKRRDAEGGAARRVHGDSYGTG